MASRRGTRDESSTAIDGSLHPRFIPVARAFRRQLAESSGGGAVCVYHHGSCVVDLWGGTRSRSGQGWTRETMAPSFSTTKGVAATLLHVLRDRGLLDYDDRVADHWPGFGQAGKQGITIRQVLSHQSGLYHIRQMIDHADRMLDWEYMIRAIERTPPCHAPGKRTGYHGLTFGFLVGEIAQRAAGRPFSELVQTEIAGPLGLDGMFIGAPQEALPRAAQLIWPRWSELGRRAALPGPVGAVARTGSEALRRLLALAGVDIDMASMLDALAPRGISSFDFGADETLRASIPASGGLFTARSLARMYAALAGRGELDGVRLLSPETFEMATTVQPAKMRRSVVPFDMRWRLGYHGVATTRGTPRGAFGHFGFGGSGAWADPGRGLGVGMIVNSGLGSPFGDLRILRLSAAVLASVGRRPWGAARESARNPEAGVRLGAAVAGEPGP